MEGKVKITVIATGFDRAGARRSTPRPSAAQTPVDLQSYAAWKQESGERVAVERRVAHDGVAARGRSTSRYRLPRADDMAGARAPSSSRRSPLDVPAFLRRQSERLIRSSTSGLRTAA